MAKIAGASDTEEEKLTTSAEPTAALQTKPVARTCCGDVAYTVGKNTADAYLKKEGEVSKAAQHFNNVESEKGKKGKDKDGCCIQ